MYKLKLRFFSLILWPVTFIVKTRDFLDKRLPQITAVLILNFLHEIVGLYSNVVTLFLAMAQIKQEDI